MDASLVIEQRAEITGRGLSLPECLGFDEWMLIGRKLMLADRAVQWAIGDWWVYGDHRYGERAAAAIDPMSGANRLQTYMNYATVSRRIETSRRREVLSWSAHAEVAALDRDVQDAILDRAVENGWSSREVRAAVHEYKAALESSKRKADPEIIDVEPEAEESEEDGTVSQPASGGIITPDAAERIGAALVSNVEPISDPRAIFGQALALAESALSADSVEALTTYNRLDPARIRSVARRLEWLAAELEARKPRN